MSRCGHDGQSLINGRFDDRLLLGNCNALMHVSSAEQGQPWLYHNGESLSAHVGDRSCRSEEQRPCVPNRPRNVSPTRSVITPDHESVSLSHGRDAVDIAMRCPLMVSGSVSTSPWLNGRRVWLQVLPTTVMQRSASSMFQALLVLCLHATDYMQDKVIPIQAEVMMKCAEQYRLHAIQSHLLRVTFRSRYDNI